MAPPAFVPIELHERLAEAAGDSAVPELEAPGADAAGDRRPPPCRLWAARVTAIALVAVGLVGLAGVTAWRRAGHDAVGALAATLSSLQGLAEQPAGAQALYCFSVIRPESYELGLMVHHSGRRLGIFGCGGHHVFSSGGGARGGVATVAVGEDPSHSCGSWACNTQILIKSWTKVIELGTYAAHDWVVKADPDTLFIPARLAQRLAQHGDQVHQPRFVQQFNYPKMHGSLEVVTRVLVDLLARDMSKCVAQLDEEHTGEDGYFSDCFDRVLQVPAIQDNSVVTQGDCPCFCNQNTIAVHPFKQVDGMSSCYDKCFW